MQFGSGILSAEPPVDGDARCVALGLVGRDLALQGVGLGVSPLETGAAQCAEFDLRHVQPTGVLGACGETRGASRCAGPQQPGTSRKGTPYDGYSDCPAPRGSPGHRGKPHPPAIASGGRSPAWCAARCWPGGAPARQGFTGQEDVAGAAASILVVLPPRSSRLRRQRLPDLGQQLGRGLVKAHHRPIGVVGFGIQVQHILHGRHEFAAYFRDAPLLLPPRLEGVFLSLSLTVS